MEELRIQLEKEQEVLVRFVMSFAKALFFKLFPILKDLCVLFAHEYAMDCTSSKWS